MQTFVQIILNFILVPMVMGFNGLRPFCKFGCHHAIACQGKGDPALDTVEIHLVPVGKILPDETEGQHFANQVLLILIHHEPFPFRLDLLSYLLDSLIQLPNVDGLKKIIADLQL